MYLSHKMEYVEALIDDDEIIRIQKMMILDKSLKRRQNDTQFHTHQKFYSIPFHYQIIE